MPDQGIMYLNIAGEIYYVLLNAKVQRRNKIRNYIAIPLRLCAFAFNLNLII